MPKISIVIPVYKVGKYIENSMKSVCAQTYRDFEVVLVDNNTPDDSIEIAERILKPSGVEYRVIKQTVQGLPAARNMGVRESKGEWIVNIDPDDTISPTYLENLYHDATKGGVDIVFCRFKETPENSLFVFEEEKEGAFSVVKNEDLMYKLLKRELSLMITNTIFKKSLFDNWDYEFDQDVILGADLIFVWRLLLRVDRIGYAQARLYNHFTREDSLVTAPSTKKIESNLNGYKKLCKYIADSYSEGFSKWVYAREVFALLSVVAIYGEYDVFKVNRNQFYSKEVYQSLREFPDKKIVSMNILLKLLPFVFFKINKTLRQPNSWLNKALHKH